MSLESNIIALLVTVPVNMEIETNNTLPAGSFVVEIPECKAPTTTEEFFDKKIFIKISSIKKIQKRYSNASGQSKIELFDKILKENEVQSGSVLIDVNDLSIIIEDVDFSNSVNNMKNCCNFLKQLTKQKFETLSSEDKEIINKHHFGDLVKLARRMLETPFRKKYKHSLTQRGSIQENLHFYSRFSWPHASTMKIDEANNHAQATILEDKEKFPKRAREEEKMESEESLNKKQKIKCSEGEKKDPKKSHSQKENLSDLIDDDALEKAKNLSIVLKPSTVDKIFKKFESELEIINSFSKKKSQYSVVAIYQLSLKTEIKKSSKNEYESLWRIKNTCENAIIDKKNSKEKITNKYYKIIDGSEENSKRNKETKNDKEDEEVANLIAKLSHIPEGKQEMDAPEILVPAQLPSDGTYTEIQIDEKFHLKSSIGDESVMKIVYALASDTQNIKVDAKMKEQIKTYNDSLETTSGLPPHLRLIPLPKIGAGIFSAVKIKKGDFLGFYPGEYTFIKAEDASPDISYMFNIQLFKEKDLTPQLKNLNVKEGDLLAIDALKCGNFTRYLNGAADENGASEARANVYYEIVRLPRSKQLEIAFFAKTDISEGEALLIDYTETYWTNMGIKPDPLAPDTFTITKEGKLIRKTNS